MAQILHTTLHVVNLFEVNSKLILHTLSIIFVSCRALVTRVKLLKRLLWQCNPYNTTIEEWYYVDSMSIIIIIKHKCCYPKMSI